MASTKRSGKARAEEREEPPEEQKEASHGIPREAQMHFARAASEFVLAMDTMFQNFAMPEDAKKHARGAHRETLLMVRSIIDANIERCDAEEKMGPSTGLRKIKVE